MKKYFDHKLSKLEELVAPILDEVCKRKGWEFKNMIGTKDDLHKGTDFIVNGLRLDITSIDKQLEGKIFFLGRKRSISYHIRLGNGVIDFEEPTLMLKIRDYSPERIEEFFMGEEFITAVTKVCKKAIQLGY